MDRCRAITNLIACATGFAAVASAASAKRHGRHSARRSSRAGDFRVVAVVQPLLRRWALLRRRVCADMRKSGISRITDRVVVAPSAPANCAAACTRRPDAALTRGFRLAPVLFPCRRRRGRRCAAGVWRAAAFGRHVPRLRPHLHRLRPLPGPQPGPAPAAAAAPGAARGQGAQPVDG